MSNLLISSVVAGEPSAGSASSPYVIGGSISLVAGGIMLGAGGFLVATGGKYMTMTPANQ